MKNKILIALLCCITARGYAQEMDELFQAMSTIEVLDNVTRAGATPATSQATLRCVQLIKPEVSSILQRICRMQDLIDIIIDDLGDVSINDELIISQLELICSKIENISVSACDVNLDVVLDAISASDDLLCSKIDAIPFGATSIDFTVDLNTQFEVAVSGLDGLYSAIDESEQLLCSKLEIIESKVDFNTLLLESLIENLLS